MRYGRSQCAVCRANLACVGGRYSACAAVISHLQLDTNIQLLIQIFILDRELNIFQRRDCWLNVAT